MGRGIVLSTFVLLGLLSHDIFCFQHRTRIINGQQVPQGAYKEVVRIKSNGSGCTATVVGPKVIITAAHCAKDNATATFEIDGTSYSAKITRSPVYPGQDHDMAIGITTKEINVPPAFVSKKDVAKSSMSITLLGYGCTQPGGGGGNDGILRYGQATITRFSSFDMVSNGGSALCFGDSGGPAFIKEGNKNILLGINSKGNISDTNYNTRIDINQSYTFMQTWTQQKGVKICGFNSDCNSAPPPPPPKPTCLLSASPNPAKINQDIIVRMTVSGNATSANIDGQTVPNTGGQITVRKSTAGNYNSTGTVANSNGSNNCQVSYTVTGDNPPPPPPPKKPTCRLTATPDWIKLGDTLTLKLETQGTVSKAYIDGQEVGFPVASISVTPEEAGNYSVSGVVVGNGSSSTCWEQYRVEGDSPPDVPDFAVVPSYCGENALKQQTDVEKVCLCKIKKGFLQKEAIVTDVLEITYKDGSKEVSPIINRITKSEDGNRTKQDLVLYANTSRNQGSHTVLDTRDATVTLEITGQSKVPLKIQGRSLKGDYYMVDELDPPGVYLLP